MKNKRLILSDVKCACQDGLIKPSEDVANIRVPDKL